MLWLHLKQWHLHKVKSPRLYEVCVCVCMCVCVCVCKMYISVKSQLHALKRMAIKNSEPDNSMTDTLILSA